MKNDKLFCFLWSVTLSFLLCFGSTMCMVTAFDLGVSVAGLTACALVSSVVFSFCCGKRLDILPLGAVAVALGCLWWNGSLEASLEAILNRLSRQYDRGYHWGIIRWSFRTADEMEPYILIMLCLFAALIALFVSRSVCRGKSAAPGVVLSIFCGATCFVVTDTQPDMIWLFCLLLGIITLLLTGFVSSGEVAQANRLRSVIAPATAFLLLAVMVAAPKDTYTGQETAKGLSQFFLKGDGTALVTGNVNGLLSSTIGGGRVDLTTVGNRVESQGHIMTLTADFDGNLYLRSKALDVYDGKSWRSSELGETADLPALLHWPMQMLTRRGEVEISTRYVHQMMYVPYYADTSVMQNVTAGIQNKQNLTNYCYDVYYLADRSGIEAIYPNEQTYLVQWDEAALSRYIYLPEQVEKWAKPLADAITDGAQSPYHKARKIASYVLSQGSYDTKTPRMPKNKDFAQWFLEESDTGYCIHYATAAAVLLQAAGVPARYVTGYSLQVKAGETVTVPASTAHAWVEYWLPGFGWMMQEVTPASRMTENRPTQPPEQTEIQTTDPLQTQPESQNQGKEQRPAQRGIWVALGIVVGAGLLLWAVLVQRMLRHVSRRKRYEAADLNGQVLLLWQDACRYGRLLKQPPEQELFDLAQKAKFSQYTLTAEELEVFVRYEQQAIGKLKRHNIFKRFYYWVILALY